MKRFFGAMFIAACALCLVLTNACDLIDDDSTDCSVTYQVQFIDDMNLSFADAFDSEVNEITLYVFDEDNVLVWSNTEVGDALHPTTGKYAMDISHLPAGNYHLVAWGGLAESRSFSMADLSTQASTLNDLTCTLNRVSRADGDDVVESELEPLFHGMTDITIPEQAEPGTYTFVINLTKDTNTVTIVLQQLDSETEMNIDEFEFTITANNGHLNHDNSLINDEQPFTYRAWSQESMSATGESETEELVSAGNLPAVVARMSTSRLVISDWTEFTCPTLTVTNVKEGRTILSIPIITYALMVRSNYTRIATSQEYLDRQDEYNMTFFLVNGRWMNSSIIINDWRVRPQDEVVY
jgi:hypothetical protein